MLGLYLRQRRQHERGILLSPKPAPFARAVHLPHHAHNLQADLSGSGTAAIPGESVPLRRPDGDPLVLRQG